MGSLILGVVLVVRLYDSSGLSDLDRAYVTAVAAQILSAASVPTSWPDCRGTRPPSPPRPRVTSLNAPLNPAAFICSRPMSGHEVAVRIIRGMKPSPRAGRVPLGYSLVDRESGGGTLATVYLDRIERLAADSATPAAPLLGRAIAHEIGHLLLGDNRHSADGIMRAVWSTRLLQHATQSDWLFTRDQAVAIQQALARDRPTAAWHEPCAS
jgi:hypothetical protein